MQSPRPGATFPGLLFLRDNQRGVALMAVLAAAILLALTVAGFLIITSSHSSTGSFNIERLRARYASDAGISWAYTQLLADPSFAPGGGPELKFDGEPQTMGVEITVEHNVGGSSSKRIRSKVQHEKF